MMTTATPTANASAGQPQEPAQLDFGLEPSPVTAPTAQSAKAANDARRAAIAAEYLARTGR